MPFDDGKAVAQLHVPAAAVCDMDARKVDASADSRKTTRTAIEQLVIPSRSTTFVAVSAETSPEPCLRDTNGPTSLEACHQAHPCVRPSCASAFTPGRSSLRSLAAEAMADNLGSVRFQQRQLRLQRQQGKRKELLTLQHVDCEKHRLVQSCDLERVCGSNDGQAAAQLHAPATALCDMDARRVDASAAGRKTTCAIIEQPVTATSSAQELRTLQHVDCEKHCLLQPCDSERARVLDAGKAAAQLFDSAAAVCDMDARKADASADGRKTTRTAIQQPVIPSRSSCASGFTPGRSWLPKQWLTTWAVSAFSRGS